MDPGASRLPFAARPSGVDVRVRREPTADSPQAASAALAGDLPAEALRPADLASALPGRAGPARARDAADHKPDDKTAFELHFAGQLKVCRKDLGETHGIDRAPAPRSEFDGATPACARAATSLHVLLVHPAYPGRGHPGHRDRQHRAVALPDRRPEDSRW